MATVGSVTYQNIKRQNGWQLRAHLHYKIKYCLADWSIYTKACHKNGENWIGSINKKVDYLIFLNIFPYLKFQFQFF